MGSVCLLGSTLTVHSAILILLQTHGAELSNMYGPGDMTDYLINFMHKFDPNGNTSKIHWEKYKADNPVVLDFIGDDAYGNDSLRLIQDTYRKDALDLLMKLNLEEPLPF